MTDCIFCKIITGDIPPKTIYEDDHTLAFLDVRPMNKGHTLVIPKKHYDMIFDVPEDVLHHVMSTVKKVAAAVDQICDGIGYPMELRLGPESVVLDFPKRAVREAIPDEKFRYGFDIAPELVRTVIRDGEPDWVNTIFLSTRFRAWRVGGYNEYLYTFFKCLTAERIAYEQDVRLEAEELLVLQHQQTEAELLEAEKQDLRGLRQLRDHGSPKKYVHAFLRR